jgi:branched-chain amino acid transport system permease protein
MRPNGVYDTKYTQDIAIVRTIPHWVLLIGGLTFLFFLPLWMTVQVINLIAIYVIAVQGLSILTGYTGQISIGQAAFMAVGAYTSALLSVYAEVSFWIALPLSGISAGIVGLIFGLPSLRIKGFYLAMATLAAQFIIPWLIIHVRPDLTEGTGVLLVPAPNIGDFQFNTQQSMFYIIMPISVFLTFAAKNLMRSGIGRAFIAIRDNDLAARVMGIEPFRYKILSFFICSFYAGISGSLWAHWMRSISCEEFTMMQSVWFLGMLIVGGMGSTAGAVFGTAAIQLLEEFTRAMSPILSGLLPHVKGTLIESLSPMVFGIIIIIFLIFEPRGINNRWEILKTSYRLWPFTH